MFNSFLTVETFAFGLLVPATPTVCTCAAVCVHRCTAAARGVKIPRADMECYVRSTWSFESLALKTAGLETAAIGGSATEGCSTTAKALEKRHSDWPQHYIGLATVKPVPEFCR